MLMTLTAIAVLILLSGFFSGSETALTAASEPVMHQRERQGDRRAGLVLRLHEKRSQLIGAILTGNNLVNILASAMATGLAIQLFGEIGVFYATAVMTVIVVLFAEVLPKVVALHNANSVSLLVAPAINVIVKLLSPVNRAMEAVLNGVLWIFGAKMTDGDRDALAEEHLRGAIDLHGEDEASEGDERAMLHSILDLADVEVGEIMIHRRSMVTIDADLPPETIVDLVLESPYTRLPVWQGDPDNVIGVLHAKALLREVRRLGDDLTELSIAELASKPWFIPDATTLSDQLQAFRSRHEHFALVVDEYGSLMGIVTLEDILEEIVGDISDEHDISVAGVRPVGRHTYVIDGSVTIRDLNRQFDWQLPDEEASTIAGLVLYEARRIPELHQVFRFHGLRFEVLRKRRNQITALRVTAAPQGAAEPEQEA